MRIKNICLGLLLAVAANAESLAPMGWATGTVGGDGGVEYHVNSFKELHDALNNNGKPNEPKIIYIDSPINGNEDETGKVRTSEMYVPGYTLDKYLNCFTEDGKEYLTTEECKNINELRNKGIPLQRESITVQVTSRTTIIGTGNDSILEEMAINISNAEQVIIKNLAIEAPRDLFAEWDPTDGVTGSWNAEYDAVVINNSTYVWVDNCLLSDGKNPNNSTKKVFGKYIELHDGLLDVINSANYITISNNRFENHQKTSLIGNSDKLTTDANHLKVSIYNNVFYKCNERLPRVRYGMVHVFNNYYYASTFDEGYPSLTVDNYYHDDSVFPSYYIGLGVESNVRSEYNYFTYEGNDEIPDADDLIVYSYGGYIFKDTGSLYNGKEIDLTTLAKESFELKVKTKAAENLAKNKANPAWINATFTDNAFVPGDYYKYDLVTDMKKVANLINEVPSWLYKTEEPVETSSVIEDLDSDEEEEILEESEAVLEDEEDSNDELEEETTTTTAAASSTTTTVAASTPTTQSQRKCVYKKVYKKVCNA